MHQAKMHYRYYSADIHQCFVLPVEISKRYADILS